jgi:hypothetical protein
LPRIPTCCSNSSILVWKMPILFLCDSVYLIIFFNSLYAISFSSRWLLTSPLSFL